MHHDKASEALNRAMRDTLTMINKGFVQSLCLRLHESRQHAQLAYGDNLAETSRLLQLLGEMQRLDMPLDPDGASGNADRGGPDLNSSAKEIWPSDASLAGRRLESLKVGLSALRESPDGGPEATGLEQLAHESEAFVADLEERAKGNENLGQFDPENVASEAEKNTLEDFLDYADGTDPSFVEGKIDRTRDENDPLFAVLNTVLGNYFLAIDQFFLHGFMMQKWQEKELAEAGIKHSVDAMRGAYRIAQHILVLGAVPKSDYNPAIRLTYHVNPGSSPLDAVHNDLELTGKLAETMHAAKELVEKISEPQSAALLSSLIDKEVETGEWLSRQMEKLSSGDATGEGSGKFDSMLKYWEAT